MTPSPGDIAGVTNVTDVEHFNYSEDYDYYALLIGAVIAVIGFCSPEKRR
ncbi:MAG: hypothetical protein HY308_11985 [Gammaproteobacteria bacterium]|nr:hypothetical protein [Gammaproteobacteria bacterium]